VITRSSISFETQTQYDKNGKTKGWLYRGVWQGRSGPWCKKPGDARRVFHRELKLEYLAEKVGRAYGAWRRKVDLYGKGSPCSMQWLHFALVSAQDELAAAERRK
jgi:hypothetical protein